MPDLSIIAPCLLVALPLAGLVAARLRDAVRTARWNAGGRIG